MGNLVGMATGKNGLLEHRGLKASTVSQDARASDRITFILSWVEEKASRSGSGRPGRSGEKPAGIEANLTPRGSP